MTRNAKAICQTCPFFRPFDDEERAKERRPAGTGQCRAEPPRVAVSPRGEVGTAWAEVNEEDWCRTHPRFFFHEGVRG